MSRDWKKASEPRRLGTIYRLRRPSIEVFEVALVSQASGERVTLIKVQENQRNGGWHGVSLPRECWADVWRLLRYSNEDNATSPPPIPSGGARDGSVGGVRESSIEVEAFGTSGHGA